METSKISEVIDNLLNTDKKAILISGPWGIGKTFNITKYCENKQKDEKINITRLSLFGKNTIEELKGQIAISGNVIGKIIDKLPESYEGEIVANITPLSNISIKGNLKNFKKRFGDIKKCDKFGNKKELVILDDFERKSNEIDIMDILGLFNELIEKNYKLVVVCNYEKFAKIDKEKIEIFKEKIFDRTYEINEIPTNIIHTIFSMYKNEIVGLESEFDGNLRLAIKTKDLYEEVLKIIDKKAVQYNSRLLMKCCVYVIMEYYYKKYSSNEECKTNPISSDYKIIDYINYYDKETYECRLLLEGLFDLVIKCDDNKIIKYYYEDEKNILDKPTFYLSDDEKLKLMRSQYDYIIGQNKLSTEIKKQIPHVLRDWCYCPIKFVDINIERLFDVLYENEISLDTFIASDNEQKLNDEYSKYKRGIELQKIKDYLKKNNIENKKKALACIGKMNFDEEEQTILIDIFRKNNYLYERFNGTINDEIWGINHYVSGIITNKLKQIVEEAKNFLMEQKYKYNDDISCKDRIESIIEQYY